jgi:hypothetical protein
LLEKKKESKYDRIKSVKNKGYEVGSIKNPIINFLNNRNPPITKNINDAGISKKFVNVYLYFVGRAYSSVDFKRVRRDFVRANEIWNRCMVFIRIANGSGVPIINGMTSPYYLINDICAENLGHQDRRGPADKKRDALINDFTPNQSIALYYIPGKAFYGSNTACAVTGNEANGSSFKTSIFMAADSDYPYILAHELGHALFFRPSNCSRTNPGPAYVIPGTRKVDPAHDNRSDNLMYPSVPNKNPIITNDQCNKARKSPYINRNPQALLYL